MSLLIDDRAGRLAVLPVKDYLSCAGLRAYVSCLLRNWDGTNDKQFLIREGTGMDGLLRSQAAIGSEEQQMLRDLIYLDAEGLASLAAQIDGTLATKERHAKSQKASAKAALFRVLGIGGEQIQTATRDVEIPAEGHLQRVLDHLSAKATIDTDIANAIRRLRQGATSFVIGVWRFDAPQVRDAADVHAGISSINHAGAIVFETGPQASYDPDDTYYRRSVAIRVEMVVSLSKMPRSRSGIMMTGHDAFMLRGHRGRGIPLHLFGQLRHLGESIQVKPYAIAYGNE